MATTSQEKLPVERIRLAADFSSALLSGESIVPGNISVSSINALSGLTSTTDIVVSSSTSSAIIYAVVKDGVAGEVHTINFSTGATNFGLIYATEINLVISNYPASENVLVTRDEIKRQLRLDDSTDDQLIDDLNIAASAYIRNRTGRDFTFSRYEEVLQPDEETDRVRLQLRHYPVQHIEKIELYDSEDTLDYSTTDASEWDYLPEGYIWFDDATNFYAWPAKNIVTYFAGYKVIPQDIRQACKDLVVAMYRSIGREGLSQETIGDYAYKAKNMQGFPDSIRRELDNSFIEGVIRRYQRHDLGWGLE